MSCSSITLILFELILSIMHSYEILEPDRVSKNLPLEADYIEVINLCRVLENNCEMLVKYRCSGLSIINIHVQVQTESQKNFPVSRKLISCSPSVEFTQRRVILKFARYISFKPSFYNKYSVFVDDAVLRMWMVGLNEKSIGFDGSKVKKEFELNVIPPFERPFRVLDLCHVWWYEVVGRMPYTPVCWKEEETVEIISYPLALSGLGIGVVKTFEPYHSKILEKHRIQSETNSSYSIWLWVYIVEYCPGSNHCGLMHHATWDDERLFPYLLITREGRIHLEFASKSRTPYAYISAEEFVPRNEWVQLLFTCESSNIWTVYMKPQSESNKWISMTVNLPQNVEFVHNDVTGNYYFGGSDIFPSFKGYFGKITYFRRRIINPTEMQTIPLDHPMFQLELSERDAKCQVYRNKVSYLMIQAEALYDAVLTKKSCPSFRKWLSNVTEKKDKLPQCRIENAPRSSGQYRFVKNAVRKWIFAKQEIEVQKLGPQLLEEAYKILDKEGLDGVTNVISLLKQGSCFGSHDASFILATIFNHGLSVEVNHGQSHSYLLSGSLNSNRLCLLSLANKHVFALDGLPLDIEQAYVYYMTVALLTKDDLTKHDDRDTITENVRLTDDAIVKAQTDEEGDLFLWLKHQASRGMLDAQRNLAKLLYWGSQGVKRNITSASAYYEAAASSGDANALYDYGIVLLKGHGVEKDEDKALQYFKMAAEQKHPQAINTLGWYALVHKRNYSEAAVYLEEAFRLGNPDAGHNLAHMMLTGIYPNINRIERTLAWDFFSMAALAGNFESGLLVAKYNMISHPRTIRNPSLSLEWARYLAEKNPAVGLLLKNGVVAFKKENWPSALMYYLMAASTGVEVANFNLAYLCEENYEYLTSYMKKECTWRHYNLSTLRSTESSNPHAWLKMADYHYMNHNISLAATAYADAAVKGDPRGLFNLAVMVENNDKVPDSAWKILSISFALSRNTEELLCNLYTRCKDSLTADAYLPCLLSLWRVKLYYFWIHYYTLIIGALILLIICGTSRIVHRLRDSHDEAPV